ncbi:hypothetical protein ACQYWQ_21775 [Streptomyces sp. P6-2-1]|uniref:hypothetical protein n=1 Tax=Streptomyces sp. P6-2-1 TaxID=3422591 RepID=UPI003D35B3F2
MKKNKAPEGMTCVIVVDGKFCGEEPNRGQLYGAPNAKVPLCGRHAAETYAWSTSQYRDKLIAQLVEIGALSFHSPGVTYIVKLPNGRVKIGMAGEERIAKRLEDVSREYAKAGYKEPLTVLALIKGGGTVEASLHHKYQELRVTDELGEQFRAEPELLDFATETGVSEEFAWVVVSYEQWWNKCSKKYTGQDPTEKAPTIDDDEWDF